MGMSYLVKWRLLGSKKILQSNDIYAVPADAIEFASAILAQDPLEIWIEGPDGLRIERQTISRACVSRRSPGPSARTGMRH